MEERLKEEIQRIWQKGPAAEEIQLGPPPPPATRGSGHQSSLRVALEQGREEIRRIVCDEWKYCKKRQETSEGKDLAVAVGDCLAAAASQIPLPIASLSVFLVRNKILDKLCDCKGLSLASTGANDQPSSNPGVEE